MAKPIYPFQPFVELHIKDDQDGIYDRLFIPEELIIDETIPSSFYYEKLHDLTSRLGYPLDKDTIMAACNFSSILPKDACIAITTMSESIGTAVITHNIVGLENAVIPVIKNECLEVVGDLVDERELAIDDVPSEVTVSSYINEVVRLNEYRENNNFIKSKITIMIIASNDDDMTESKNEWLHYHANNYMNRGYEIYIENQSKTGKDLMQYMIDCQYSNCVVVLDGEPVVDIKPLKHQPIDACVHNKPGKATARSVMEQFATHGLDPSMETVKQTNALTIIQA